MLPRLVGFNKNGIAVCVGVAIYTNHAVLYTRVIQLPSTNPDFIDFNVSGKTEQQIREELL